MKTKLLLGLWIVFAVTAQRPVNDGFRPINDGRTPVNDGFRPINEG
jgi:hypothetical protein